MRNCIHLSIPRGFLKASKLVVEMVKRKSPINHFTCALHSRNIWLSAYDHWRSCEIRFPKKMRGTAKLAIRPAICLVGLVCVGVPLAILKDFLLGFLLSSRSPRRMNRNSFSSLFFFLHEIGIASKHIWKYSMLMRDVNPLASTKYSYQPRHIIRRLWKLIRAQ